MSTESKKTYKTLHIDTESKNLLFSLKQFKETYSQLITRLCNYYKVNTQNEDETVKIKLAELNQKRLEDMPKDQIVTYLKMCKYASKRIDIDNQFYMLYDIARGRFKKAIELDERFLVDNLTKDDIEEIQSVTDFSEERELKSSD